MESLHKEALNWIIISGRPGINPFLGLTYQHPHGIGLLFEYQKNGNIKEQNENLGEEHLLDFVSVNVSLVAILSF